MCLFFIPAPVIIVFLTMRQNVEDDAVSRRWRLKAHKTGIKKVINARERYKYKKKRNANKMHIDEQETTLDV